MLKVFQEKVEIYTVNAMYDGSVKFDSAGYLPAKVEIEIKKDHELNEFQNHIPVIYSYQNQSDQTKYQSSGWVKNSILNEKTQSI